MPVDANGNHYLSQVQLNLMAQSALRSIVRRYASAGFWSARVRDQVPNASKWAGAEFTERDLVSRPAPANYHLHDLAERVGVAVAMELMNNDVHFFVLPESPRQHAAGMLNFSAMHQAVVMQDAETGICIRAATTFDTLRSAGRFDVHAHGWKSPDASHANGWSDPGLRTSQMSVPYFPPWPPEPSPERPQQVAQLAPRPRQRTVNALTVDDPHPAHTRREQSVIVVTSREIDLID